MNQAEECKFERSQRRCSGKLQGRLLPLGLSWPGTSLHFTSIGRHLVTRGEPRTSLGTAWLPCCRMRMNFGTAKLAYEFERLQKLFPVNQATKLACRSEEHGDRCRTSSLNP